MIRFLVLGVTIAALAGCERVDQGEPAEPETAEAGGEAPRLTPVDGPPAPEEPLLAGLAYADIEAELEPGAGCHAEQDGKNLLTAIDGDAIAKPYGTLRHFEFAGAGEQERGPDALWHGGSFTAGAITVTVAPAEGEGEQIGEVTVREAEIAFSEEGQPGARTLTATWQCGS